MASKSVKAITFIAILLFVCLLAAEAAEVTANNHRNTCKRKMNSCSHYNNCYNYCRSQNYYGGGCQSGYCYCYYYC
ncbi:hypothetical protein Scep_011248 [Stephania cephalantha]|uniref:Defensin n=1 Tax=Stephania cephalantha TaxID=152367 RepID=A0AAP0JDT4_9MAGN